MDFAPKPIFPFREGEWCTVRDLREAAAEILARTASDEEFAAAMRVRDPKLYPWSKSWMEEIFPCWRLADELRLSDHHAFKWTPLGAADIEFRSDGKVVKIQCTMAYAERGGTIAKQGGHLRSLEMEQSNATGMVWLGGGLTTPRTVDVGDDREAWRVDIANAIGKKLKPEYRGCWLLIYAPRCQFDLVDGDDFRDVVKAAAARIGRDQWGAIFEGLYVLDYPSGAFLELPTAR
jgi:hypothetical protein